MYFFQTLCRRYLFFPDSMPQIFFQALCRRYPPGPTVSTGSQRRLSPGPTVSNRPPSQSLPLPETKKWTMPKGVMDINVRCSRSLLPVYKLCLF